MSVLECNRKGCDNIYDNYSEIYGYLCQECLQELTEAGSEPTIPDLRGLVMPYNLTTELKLAEKAVNNYNRYKHSLETFRIELICEMEGTCDDYIYSKELTILANPDIYEFDKVKEVVLRLSQEYPNVDFEY